MKVYLLEDELLVQDYIKNILKNIDYVEIVGCSETVSKAAEDLTHLHVDLILADINLKDTSSFKLFDLIPINNYDVIFATAFDQYAIQALNIGAIGYILKPFDASQLEAMIDKVYKRNSSFKITEDQFKISSNYFQRQIRPQKIVLKNLDFVQYLSFDKILYCEGDKGYATFYLKEGGKIVVCKNLKEYEDLLFTPNFIRCHQSFIVNMDYVHKYYKSGYIEMESGIKIPVATRKKDLIMNYYEN